MSFRVTELAVRLAPSAQAGGDEPGGDCAEGTKPPKPKDPPPCKVDTGAQGTPAGPGGDGCKASLSSTTIAGLRADLRSRLRPASPVAVGDDR
jgi:hypothetical protein